MSSGPIFAATSFTEAKAKLKRMKSVRRWTCGNCHALIMNVGASMAQTAVQVYVYVQSDLENFALSTKTLPIGVAFEVDQRRPISAGPSNPEVKALFAELTILPKIN